ncbi:MAG: hypothetical protein J0L64_26105 [Acidobacteria bacterium]|nr:hypothetical protein [Acidobacteriota bacterium]
MESTWRRWCLPDLSTSAALLTLVYVLFLFDGPHRLFRDSDSGWHIRTGERILDSLTLPRLDPYSFGKPAAAWVAWEWAADVLMGAAHRLGGLGAVAWLYTVAIAACSWLWFQLQWQLGSNFLIACALASPMLSTANIHWLARPHIFGWTLLLIALLWLERDAPPSPRRPWYHWALLAALWANLHASFFLLPLLAALYSPRLGWTPTLASALATLLNPYGPSLHLHIFHYLRDRELLRLIGEFQSFNFHSDGAAQIAVALILSLSAVGLFLSRRDYTRAAVTLLFCAIAIRSARGLPLMALAALPFAGRAFSQLPWPPAFTQYAANLRTLDRSLSGPLSALAVLTASYLFCTTPYMQARTGFPASDFPVQASSQLAALPPQARLFAPDKFGGYLIYRFAGSRPVFFDGRSDYYGAAFMKDYIALVQVRPHWLSLWKRHGFTHAVLPLDYSLNSVLPTLGWRELHRDSTVVLWTQPPSHPPVNP